MPTLLLLLLMLDRCQELYHSWLQTHGKDQDSPQLRELLHLGLDLAVDVHPWLEQLD